VSAGWLSPSSRGLWGGDTLLLSARLLETDTPAHRGLSRVIATLVQIGCAEGANAADGRLTGTIRTH
jgi:hypothetical protein